MRAGTSTTLLLAVLLSASSLFAQRGTGSSGGIRGPGVGPARISVGHFPHNGNFGRHHGYGSVIYPYWFGDPYGYEEEYVEQRPQAPPPTVIVEREKSTQPDREVAPAEPKILEIQGGASANSARSQAPAVFVLNDGQRIESQRYLITASVLHVTVDRSERNIPLSQLDIKRTLAANHERGIELSIPVSSSEISLSF